MTKKCDLCVKEQPELDMFHYEMLVNEIVEEVLVCEDCLFDLVGKDFCDGLCSV